MFKAKDIRADTIFPNSKSITEVGGITKKNNKLMERQEENWADAQKWLQREQIIETHA